MKLLILVLSFLFISGTPASADELDLDLPDVNPETKPNLDLEIDFEQENSRLKLTAIADKLLIECKKDASNCARYEIFSNQLKEKYGVEHKYSSLEIENEKVFKTETCQWATDLPPRLVTSPGCGTGKTNTMCVGTVICEFSNGGKFTRMAFCSSDNCGPGSAGSCVGEKGYKSESAIPARPSTSPTPRGPKAKVKGQ